MKHTFNLTPLSFAIALALSTNVAHAEEMGTLVVEGDTEQSSTSNNFNYVSKVAQTATKTDEQITKIPRAVSVVTREQMDDRAPISISDALQYTPSIQTNFYGEDNKQDWFVIRGFKQANNGLYQDGTRLYSSGFYSWQIDPFMLERIEVLRGPASALNGQTPPGGVVNVISKRAQLEEDFGSVTGTIGSYDRKEINLDVNKVINDKLAFRMVALSRENGTKVDEIEANRTLLAPSLAWKISDNTKLTVLASYQKDDSDPYLQFLPVEGTLTSNPNGKIGYDTALGNADWETFQREQTSVGYELEHAFNDSLSFQQSARFSHMDINLRQMYFAAYAQDLGLSTTRDSIIRGATTADGDSDAFNIDNRFIYKFNTGNTKHTLLTGIDYQSIDINNKDYPSFNRLIDPIVANSSNPNFNIYNPSYSNNITLLNPDTNAILTDADLQTTKTKNRQLGFYLQDKANITDKFTVMAGARYDDTSNETNNTSTNSKTDIDLQQWTGNLGASYQLDNGLVPYANYAQSFTPILALDANNNPAKPEEADSYEVGVKFKPQSFDGQFGIAAYQVTKENLTSGSSGTANFRQLGEVRNRGIEFEAVANLNRAFTVVGTLSYVDSEIIEDKNNSANVGNTPAQIASKLASVWGNYSFIDGILDGVKVGAGVRYIGETYADDTETNTVPSYALVDAMASYQVDNYKFQLVAKNLFDKEYIATCYGFCYYGDSRNIMASVSYDW
ncbi:MULTISPECIES: TonB-dependent siderophore receptor [Marinomonas]|uniref:TonB-dependent siderophore receptor n=1 Tax=Marinomonas arctica TaxID=383750 RepID=A0A7H1J6Q8_9GAMM|nr:MULTISPECIES: TonB-dependent siderophore receptor [Marinomonas]MCS7485148.1 ligand-gated channel protein [Marinomonas sp. BSi20414]QNT06174.1 TonB-dependent siderophore receptor [Marinomonas arctica]GGN18226.1 TonB-dependent receptor [Marinomonas arctica]